MTNQKETKPQTVSVKRFKSCTGQVYIPSRLLTGVPPIRVGPVRVTITLDVDMCSQQIINWKACIEPTKASHPKWQ